MRATGALLFVTAVVCPLRADPPKLSIPADLRPVNGYVRFVPDTTAKTVTYIALSGVYPFPAEELRDARRFVLPASNLKAGRYEFIAVGSLNDEHTVVPFSVPIGDAPPTPPGPTPPTPPGPTPPGPTPPGPTPTPAADPIGAGGFAVLITFDSSNTTRPPGEQSVLYGKAVTEYLESKCVADPTAPGTKAYRIWPANSDTGRAPKLWADAFAKKSGVDWIAIGTGAGGYTGPLPKSEADALALLKKYGGE